MINELIYRLFEIRTTALTDFVLLGVGIIAVLSWLYQLYLYFFVYLRVVTYRKVNIKTVLEPVSVIICARNEYHNLQKNLPHILNQFYPDFQVIVVDDGSDDGSEELLAEMQKKYPQLYFTHIEHTHPYPHAKKLAQTIGIKAAKYDQLLFTDADCRPASPNWIRHMQSNFVFKTEIILGYGAYESYPGLLNLFIRTDTLYIAMQYMGMALKGKPFSGAGRNLAYRRGLFFDNKGFASHLHLQSGDDDLFINETANAGNTTVEVHPESITFSEPKRSFRSWFYQKRRHLTTGFHYKTIDKVAIGAEVISRVLFYLTSILLLIFGTLTGYILIMLITRYLVHLIILKTVMNRFQERKILLFSIIYDLVMPIITASLLLVNRFSKKIKFAWR